MFDVPSEMSNVIHFPMLYIPNIHTYTYCISHDIYLRVLWCTMLLPHALHAKLDPLSTQTLFPKPQPDAPIKGIQVQSMPHLGFYEVPESRN